MSTGTDQPLLQFPCEFPLKVMGQAGDDFAALVVEIVARHVPTLRDDAVQQRPSKQGTYVSLTVTVHVHSQAQLDNLYCELSGHARVLMVL